MSSVVLDILVKAALDQASVDTAVADVERGFGSIDLPELTLPPIVVPPIEIPPIEVPPVELPPFAPPDVDLSKLISGYDDATEAAKKNLDTQKKALAALIASGEEGGGAYAEVLGGAIDAQRQVEELTSVAKRAEQLLSQPIDFDVDVNGEKAIATLADSYSDAEKAAKDSLASQTAALAQLILEGKEGSSEFDELAKKIAATKDQADGFEDAMKRARDATGQGDGGDGGGLFDTLLKSEAAGKAAEFFGGIAEKGNEARKVAKSVQAQVGATTEEMKGLKAAGTDAYSHGIGESANDALKKVGIANQQLKEVLDPKGLEDFIRSAGGISEVYESEFADVIQKGKPFIQNFKLEGQEAGDLIALGMQKAGGATGDFLDTINEYSQLAPQMGFEATEWTGLLIKGVQEGARDTDKLADTLKETQIRLKAGDISTSLAGISSPITAQIQDIVKAGEQGKLSVKEVLQQSAAGIEEAFDSGKITEAMRSKLQVAISGTPAEDLGSDLYGRIFSTPIDTASIEAQARLAGKTLADAIEPQGIGEKISRTFESLATDVSAEVAPVADAVSTGLSGISQIAPGIGLAKDAIGGLTSAFPGMASGLTSAMGVMTGPVGIGLLAAAAVAGGIALAVHLMDPINQLNDAIDDSKEAFAEYDNAIKDQQAVNAMGDSLSSLADRYDALSKSSDPKSQEELIAVSKQLAEQAPETVDGLKQVELQSGKNGDAYVVETDKLRGLIEERKKEAATRTQQAETDAVDSLGGLLNELDDSAEAMKKLKEERAEYQKAVDEGKGDQVLGVFDFESAKTNLKDAQNDIGELTATQSKAREAARQHVEELQTQGKTLGQIAQETHRPIEQIQALGNVSLESGNKALQLFGPDKIQATERYSKNVEGLTKVYQDQQSELAKLEEQRKKEGSSPELEKSIERQKAAIANTGQMLKQQLDAGRQAGLGTERQIKQVATAYHITEREAADLVKQQQKLPEAVADSKRSVGTLATAFNDASSKAQSSFSEAKSAIAQLIYEGKQGTQEWSDAMAQVRDRAAEAGRIADAQKRADELIPDPAQEQARREAAEQKRRDGIEKSASRTQQTEERRINGLERTAARERALIANERERREREINDTQRFADLRLKAQEAYLTATNFDGEKTQDIKNAGDERKAAEAQQRADLLALDKEFDRTETENRRARVQEDAAIEQAATERLVEQLRTRGATSLEAVQAQGAAESRLRKQQRDSQLQQEVEGSREYQDAVAELWARVAAAPAASTFTPDAIAAEMDAITNRVRASLETGTTAAAESYQTLRENLNETDLRAVEEQGFREAEARARSIADRAEREFKLREIAAARQQSADLRAAGTDATAIAAAKLRYDQSLAIAREEREIAGITDRAERTRRIELLEAKKTLQAALDASKGSLGAQEDAYFAYVQKKREIDEAYARDSNVLVAAALDLQKYLYTGFLHDITEERRAQLEEEQDAIAQQTDENIAAYQSGAIALEEYYDKAHELASRQLAIENELGEARYTWAQALTDLNAGAAAAFSASSKSFSDSLDKAVQTASDLRYASDKELTELGSSSAKRNDDVAVQMEKAWTSAGATIVATTLQVGVEGENMLKAAANTTIDVAAKLLTAQIPVWIAGLYGTEVSKLGLAGIATAAVATGVLYSIVAVAKSALAAAKFKDGGFTGKERNRLIVVNDGDGEDFEEHVASGPLTRRYRDLFADLDAGRGLSGYVRRNINEVLPEWGEISATVIGLDGRIAWAEGAIDDTRGLVYQALADAGRHERYVPVFNTPEMRSAMDVSQLVEVEQMVAEQRNTTAAVNRQTEVLERVTTAQSVILEELRKQAVDRLGNLREQNESLPQRIAQAMPTPTAPPPTRSEIYARR